MPPVPKDHMLYTNHSSWTQPFNPKLHEANSSHVIKDMTHSTPASKQHLKSTTNSVSKLFDLSSNHTHFILKAFSTTSLFHVETVRPITMLSAVQSRSPSSPRMDMGCR